jgi:hypothetical protein
MAHHMGESMMHMCNTFPCPICTPSIPANHTGSYTFYQTGWVCPKCEAVMAPFMPVCTTCKPKASS